MYKVKIFSVGKTKERWLEEAIDLYIKRLKGKMTIEWLFAKDDAALLSQLNKERHFILLDENGKQHTSRQFSSMVIDELEKNGSRLNLVIGGAEGLPPSLKEKGNLISLSKLTFTHQIARLTLVEQLYRALQIEQNTPYHKD